MSLIEQRKVFESNKKIYESAKLCFKGVDGFDVYNPSIPFDWHGKKYMFSRIERRHEWARSWVRLFENTGPNEWTVVPDSMIYQLEDPFISIIGDELVLGGVHVVYKNNEIDKYYTYFYRGKDIHDLRYFTTGPECMKDIRLVELENNKIGVFSRPKSEEIKKLYGSDSIVGFATINSLDEFSSEVIENAVHIPNLFKNGEWGGCNQAYKLEDGCIGVVGHKSCRAKDEFDQEVLVYTNTSFIFDPVKHEIIEEKIIGTRSCYPEGPAKKTSLVDIAFSAGIILNEFGQAELYSGINDCEVGKIVVDNPFERIKQEPLKGHR